MIYFLWSHLSKNLLTERGHYQNCVKFVDVLNGWSLTLFDSWSCKKWIWIHHSKEDSLFLGGGTVILRLKYMPYTCACAQDGARKRRLSIFGKPTSTDCWVTAHLLAFFASFWYYSPIFFSWSPWLHGNIWFYFCTVVHAVRSKKVKIVQVSSLSNNNKQDLYFNDPRSGFTIANTQQNHKHYLVFVKKNQYFVVVTK